MDEGTSRGIENTGKYHGKRVAHGDTRGKEASTGTLRKRMRLHKLSDAVHLNAAHCRFKKCIDVALDTCNEVHELIHTWRENHWHLPGKCLRLNKRKCEDLHQYLERTKKSYTPSITCEIAAGEYLTAVKRAKNLVEESSHNDWLLKAVELWECSEHFVEVFLDLCWSSHIMSMSVKNSKEQESWMAREQEWLLKSRRSIAQAKTQSCDDKEKLGAMVRATLSDGAVKKGSAEHQLARLLEDRLNDQSSWHPPILTSFSFSLRSRFRLLSRGASKTGASGVVLTFPWVYEKLFAVKMRHRNTNNVLRTFKNEFEVLDKYRSPYIVRVVGYWELESSWLDMRPWARSASTLCPFLLMEAMEFDLEGLIHRYRELLEGSEAEEGFSALEAIQLMLPVAKALRFLHDKDVAHRDVKLQNIMCSNAMGDFDDAIVKLIDFGEAVVGVSRIPRDMNRPAGTKGYMDPEMWKVDPETGMRSGYDLFRADVFSFAMVFVELLTWRSPWGKMGREVQVKLNAGGRPPLPDDLPEYVSFIVECCWCADATARPTFMDICSMLQSAKLLLLDENFFGERDDLFCYLDGDCIERSIFDTEFLQ